MSYYNCGIFFIYLYLLVLSVYMMIKLQSVHIQFDKSFKIINIDYENIRTDRYMIRNIVPPVNKKFLYIIYFNMIIFFYQVPTIIKHMIIVLYNLKKKISLFRVKRIINLTISVSLEYALTLKHATFLYLTRI